MKIAFYETEKWEEEYLKEKFEGHNLIFYPHKLSLDSGLQKDAEVICTFTDSKITPEIINALPELKFVVTRTTGFDHINLEECAQRNILVSNVPTYGENTVAEFTFALLLALSRKLYPAIKRVKEEGKFNFEGLKGLDLKGKTIGVVGTGHIGAYVVTIAKGFGMEIVAYDPYPNEKLSKEFGFKYASLEELLKISDVITLHVPYMPATHHLLNKENMKLLKPGSLLVNTARGGLVETSGLVEALAEGRLAGAALDVLEEEGFIKDELNLIREGHPNEQQLKTILADHELMKFDNVLVTPHNAFNTKEAIERILDTTVDNIKSFVGGKPQNLVKSK